MIVLACFVLCIQFLNFYKNFRYETAFARSSRPDRFR